MRTVVTTCARAFEYAKPAITIRSTDFQIDLMAHHLRSLQMVDVGTRQAAGGEGVRRELIASRNFMRAAFPGSSRRTLRRKASTVPDASWRSRSSSRHPVATT